MSLPEYISRKLEILTKLLITANNTICGQVYRNIESIIKIILEIFDIKKLWELKNPRDASGKIIHSENTVTHTLMNWIRDKFINSLENVAKAINVHYPFKIKGGSEVNQFLNDLCDKDSQESLNLENSRIGLPVNITESNQQIFIDHALVYQGVCKIFIKLLDSIFDFSKNAVREIWNRLAIRDALKLLSVDQAVTQSISDAAFRILKILDSEAKNSRFSECQTLRNLMAAMSKSWQFYQKIDAGNDVENSSDTDFCKIEIFTDAETATSALEIYQSESFILKLVDSVIDFGYETLPKPAYSAILKCLAHSHSKIKSITYERINKRLTEILNTNEAVTNSTKLLKIYNQLRLFANSEVIEEIFEYGCYNKNLIVKNYATDIIFKQLFSLVEKFPSHIVENGIFYDNATVLVEVGHSWEQGLKFGKIGFLK